LNVIWVESFLWCPKWPFEAILYFLVKSFNSVFLSYNFLRSSIPSDYGSTLSNLKLQGTWGAGWNPNGDFLLTFILCSAAYLYYLRFVGVILLYCSINPGHVALISAWFTSNFIFLALLSVFGDISPKFLKSSLNFSVLW